MSFCPFRAYGIYLQNLLDHDVIRLAVVLRDVQTLRIVVFSVGITADGDDADNVTVILIEDDHADAKAEVLEVLTHAEKVTCEVVVQHEVIHLRFHLCGGKPRVIDKSAIIADFGIEHLASAHRLVRLDEVNDIVRHLVVNSPWNVLHLVVDDDWCDVVLLLEDFRCLGGEDCGGVDARDGGNGCRWDKW